MQLRTVLVLPLQPTKITTSPDNILVPSIRLHWVQTTGFRACLIIHYGNTDILTQLVLVGTTVEHSISQWNTCSKPHFPFLCSWISRDEQHKTMNKQGWTKSKDFNPLIWSKAISTDLSTSVYPNTYFHSSPSTLKPRLTFVALQYCCRVKKACTGWILYAKYFQAPTDSYNSHISSVLSKFTRINLNKNN